MKAFICDLDGTLYNSDARRDACFTPEKKDFDRWNREAYLDLPHEWCAQLIQAMRAVGYFPVFVSGRDVAYRVSTEAWIKRYLNMKPEEYSLHMRPTGDYRKDSLVKNEIYENHLKDKFEILFAVDDRGQVVDMWRSIGITCLQCADGKF